MKESTLKDLNDLSQKAHFVAMAKGWWDEYPIDYLGKLVLSPDVIGAKLALQAGEIVGESLECVRDGEMEMHVPDESTGKPEGFVVEQADAVIRIMDTCRALRLDLWEAVEAKMAYNEGRPHRHGGKLL